MTQAEKKPVSKNPLGRGLNALFGEDDAYTISANDMAAPTPGRSVTHLPLSALTPGPFQPRKFFSEESLTELAASLKQHGMVQPIVVRPKPNATGEYQIIAGERRWRAAQRVPMHDVPVVIQNIDDKTALEIALIENLQRADLNPLEEARAYQRLVDEYSYKHEQLATVLGKSRSHITNMLRLLQLPVEIQDKLLDGTLSMGHARALITAERPIEIVEQIVRNDLSVRDTEKLTAKRQNNQSGSISPVSNQALPQKDADIRNLETGLSQLLGLKVTIEASTASRGKLSIEYLNLDQLDDVLRRLSR